MVRVSNTIINIGYCTNLADILKNDTIIDLNEYFLFNNDSKIKNSSSSTGDDWEILNGTIILILLLIIILFINYLRSGNISPPLVGMLNDGINLFRSGVTNSYPS